MVRILQINVKHCKAAMSNIYREVSKDDQTIALLQDPWFHEYIIKASKGYSVYSFYVSRACIIALCTIPLSFSHHLSALDCTVCYFDIQVGKTQIYLASIYSNRNKDCILPAMASFCKFLQTNKSKGILCIDSNPHSTLWALDQKMPWGPI